MRRKEKKKHDALKKDPWLFKRETKHGLEKHRNKSFGTETAQARGEGL